MAAYRIAIALGAATALAMAGVAFAAGDDRTQAESIVAELERDAAHRAVTADPVARAKQALERGKQLRANGDEPHARIADGLAREWAELGRDLVRTAAAEQRAADARRAANDAGAQAERERALVEEGIAQNGRLRAQLEQAEREKQGNEPQDKTSKIGAALDGGGAPKKPAPKKPGVADGGGP